MLCISVCTWYNITYAILKKGSKIMETLATRMRWFKRFSITKYWENWKKKNRATNAPNLRAAKFVRSLKLTSIKLRNSTSNFGNHSLIRERTKVIKKDDRKTQEKLWAFCLSGCRYSAVCKNVMGNFVIFVSGTCSISSV